MQTIYRRDKQGEDPEFREKLKDLIHHDEAQEAFARLKVVAQEETRRSMRATQRAHRAQKAVGRAELTLWEYDT